MTADVILYNVICTEDFSPSAGVRTMEARSNFDDPNRSYMTQKEVRSAAHIYDIQALIVATPLYENHELTSDLLGIVFLALGSFAGFNQDSERIDFGRERSL